MGSTGSYSPNSRAWVLTASAVCDSMVVSGRREEKPGRCVWWKRALTRSLPSPGTEQVCKRGH
jgi:hypothetical protein